MAEIHPMKTAAEIALGEAYGAVRDALPGTDEVRLMRDDAFESFRRTGLPHRRVEDWKYTDLRTLMRDARPLAPSPDSKALDKARLPSGIIRDQAHLRLTLVNGTFSPELSDVGLLPAGVHVTSLAEALASGDPAVTAQLGVGAPDNAALALNSAFMTDGIVLIVDPGTTVQLPVLLQTVHGADVGDAVYCRSLIVLGDGASMTFVDTYEGSAGAANQTNSVLEVRLGSGARLDRVSAQTESLETIHVSSLLVSLGSESRFSSFGLTAGAAVSRSQIYVTCAGENARLVLAGATMLSGRRHADTTLVVDHAVPGGESRERFKTVLDGEARAVFQGKIIVRPGAQKTDGRMMSQSILLSDAAEIDNKPELEIFADDVQCAHGATCGALDEDLIFYLNARGIPKEEAEALLLQAFLGEAMDMVENEGLRLGLTTLAEHWLANRV